MPERGGWVARGPWAVLQHHMFVDAVDAEGARAPVGGERDANVIPAHHSQSRQTVHTVAREHGHVAPSQTLTCSASMYLKPAATHDGRKGGGAGGGAGTQGRTGAQTRTPVGGRVCRVGRAGRPSV